MEFTPMQIWAGVIAIIGFALTVLNIIDKAISLRRRAKEPYELISKRVSNLEEKQKEIKRRLNALDIDMSHTTEHMDVFENGIESDMSKTNKVIVESLQALTAHAIDGNNINELKEAKRNLDDYLLEKL